jgi:uncharacterized membrane protein
VEWSFIDDVVMLVISIAIAAVVLMVVLVVLYLWVKGREEGMDETNDDGHPDKGLLDDRQRF